MMNAVMVGLPGAAQDRLPADVPGRLTGLNREALYIRRDVMASVSEADPPDDPESANLHSDMAFASEHIAGETLQLLIDATWHPTLGALTAGGALASSPALWTYAPGPAPIDAANAAGNAKLSAKPSRN
jgi:hypothetical protein